MSIDLLWLKYTKVFCIVFVFMSFSIPGFSQYEQITIERSDTVIDCNGGLLNDGKATYLVISSRETSEGWVQTQNVTIQNCTIRGGARIIGLGKNGQAPGVKSSSLSLGHTERAQAAAPTNIKFSNVTFESTNGITLLYLAPGTTYATIEDCVFSGVSTGSGPVIYLDAESAHNTFRNNTLKTTVGREVIGCDGSAYNLFEGNRFDVITKGGIYLYRNCGEGGSIRHQTPHHNIIRNNTFNLSNLVFGNYGIWLGSRNGNRKYCDDDAGYPFGSSLDNNDFADNNTLEDNVFKNSAGTREVSDNGEDNQINDVSSVKNTNATNEPVIHFVDGQIRLSKLTNNTYIKIYDATGRTVISQLITNNEISYPHQLKGICFVRLSNKDQVLTKKIIVN